VKGGAPSQNPRQHATSPSTSIVIIAIAIAIAIAITITIATSTIMPCNITTTSSSSTSSSALGAKQTLTSQLGLHVSFQRTCCSSACSGHTRVAPIARAHEHGRDRSSPKPRRALAVLADETRLPSSQPRTDLRGIGWSGAAPRCRLSR